MDPTTTDHPHPSWPMPDGGPTPPPGPDPDRSSARPRWSARRRVAAAALAVVTLLSVGVPAGWALDRFVIDHVTIADVSAYEAALSAESATGTSGTTVTNGSTTDDATTGTVDAPGITIDTVVTGSGADTVTYYVADVVLETPPVALGVRGERVRHEHRGGDTPQIAADNEADVRDQRRLLRLPGHRAS